MASWRLIARVRWVCLYASQTWLRDRLLAQMSLMTAVSRGLREMVRYTGFEPVTPTVSRFDLFFGVGR